jgi:uncharacterized lipoprotein YmbA
MKKILLAGLACLALAGCAGAPESQAQKAENAACTAQANAQYNANTVDLGGRTAQTGLMYSATPNHVFDAEQMGAMHQRESQISDCEKTGNNNGQPQTDSVPAIVPHIVIGN